MARIFSKKGQKASQVVALSLDLLITISGNLREKFCMQDERADHYVLSALQEKDTKAKVESIEGMGQKKWNMSLEVKDMAQNMNDYWPLF